MDLSCATHPTHVGTHRCNSGSATINSDFELVGLAFDGMLETIIADYKYIPEARTISVDSRYFLWTLDKLENAENILEELSITK